MISRKLSIQLKKLLTLVGTWLLIGFLISVYDYFGLISEVSKEALLDYDFMTSLGFNLSAAFMGSVMGGSFLIFYVNEKLKDQPYGYSLLAVAVSFIVIVSLITVVLGFVLVQGKTGNWPFTEVIATQKFYAYLQDPLHLKNILVWSVVTMFTQFFLQVNDKFGQGLLWDFIRGKYHTPREEVRVFMFLDLASSTTIAERLGNKQYYNLLRDFYADITNSIIYNSGQIYQYVGDEVVISWLYEDAIINHQCVKCFFDVKKRIATLSEKYKSKYGLVPGFKAALHYGNVTAGEIGIIKKDITYSGDVLNTTSRMLSKCNEYHQRLLVSGQLYQSLRKVGSFFGFHKIGDEHFRGKSEKVEIYTVTALSPGS
ncbi:MAG: adenylate/guanylate cyclase domain-containing protein [Cytophagales bacterium]|nr:adenylate/guanylate cyclase domain-containing protein [Cytophagales bacterium]